MMRKNIIVLIAGVLLLTSITTITTSLANSSNRTDFDPLVDVEVTVELQTIRWLEEKLSTLPGSMSIDVDAGIMPSAIQKALGNNYGSSTAPFENLELGSSEFTISKKATTSQDELNFYVKVFVNDVEFESDVWENTKYIYDSGWSATLNVPDEEEFVNIRIQLWNAKLTGDVLCDISGDADSKDVNLVYSIKTGHWTGDDALSDASGYGRLCGCDDGTIYQQDDDCEIWFNIYQNDFDGDDIPYWIEVNDYGTDPEVSNIGEDADNDDIPIEWEWKLGYDPLVWDNHNVLDPDGDSLNNYEEYLTSAWFSDPFRKDVYVELDLMGVGPNGETAYFPEQAAELIQTAFDRQNIIFHLDYGTMGGHDIIPYIYMVDQHSLNQIYYNYFLHGNENNWRRGVFHYGLVSYRAEGAAGYMFRNNAFQIASFGHDNMAKNKTYLDKDIIYASAYMHELGHTFGFWPIPGHNRLGGIAGLMDWLRCLPYKSIMNYGYMYVMVDYSDGSRRSPDLDDWDPSRMLFDYFEDEWADVSVSSEPLAGATSSEVSQTQSSVLPSNNLNVISRPNLHQLVSFSAKISPLNN